MLTGWNLIPLNRNRPDDHYKTAERLLDFEPEIICPGHGGPYEVTRDDLLLFRDGTSKIPAKFQALIGDRNVNQALDFYWAQVFPYEQSIKPGEPFSVKVTITNHESASANGTLTAALPQGWSTPIPSQKIHIHGNGQTDVEFTILPGDRRSGAPAKVAFGFDLELNGKPYGEACHGIGNYIRYPYHG